MAAAYFDDNDDRNSSADSDFFSPISASFFRPKQQQQPSKQQQPPHHRTKPQGSGEKLPPLHDSSWIGARLSPIGSFDNEAAADDDDDDDDDRRKTSAYHQALHDSIEAADFIVANERTRLLRPPVVVQQQSNHASNTHPHSRGRPFSNTATAQARGGQQHHLNRSSTIHPLWDQPPPSSSSHHHTSDVRVLQHRARQLCTWGNFVCTVAGALYIAMAYHDYQEWSSGNYAPENSSSSSTSQSSWSLLWLRPPEETLRLFGAFVPAAIQSNVGEYVWRSVSSAFLCSSLIEYIFVVGAWRLIGLMRLAPNNHRYSHSNATHAAPQQPWYQWSGVYVTSCLAGQLWMTAFDGTNGALTGCMAWSTCGVLTHVGMQSFSRRLIFFCTAAWLLIMSLLQRPYSSVMGTVGASFFGWSLAVAELFTIQPPHPPTNNASTAKAQAQQAHTSQSMWVCWIGRIVALKIVLLPTLFISFLF